MTIDHSLLADCRRLVVQLAPELGLHPVYVESAELFRDLPCNTGCTLGWADTGPLFDRNVADRLGDRYCGPGCLIVIDGEAIAAEAKVGAFRRCALNVAIHEAAHQLPAHQVFEPADTTFSREWQAARMKSDFTKAEPEPGSEHDHHGPQFVRRATHLAYRALVADVDFTLHRLFGPQLWLSRPEFYLCELLAECSRMTGATFAEIEATEPPAGFIALWQGDLKFYQKNIAGETNVNG